MDIAGWASSSVPVVKAGPFGIEPLASAVGFDRVTVGHAADAHKAYYRGGHRIAMRYTGDRHAF
jgi:hypothetical protein